MYNQHMQVGTIYLSVAGYEKSDKFIEPVVVINTNSGGLYGSLHLTPAEAVALGKCLADAAAATEATVEQVAA